MKRREILAILGTWPICLASRVYGRTQGQSGSAAPVPIRPLSAIDVRAKGWLEARILRSARRLHQLEASGRLFFDLEPRGQRWSVKWGAGYPSEWLQAALAVQRCTPLRFPVRAVCDRLITYQQNDGHIGSGTGESGPMEYFGDARALVAFVQMAGEGDQKALGAARRLAGWYSKAVRENDWGRVESGGPGLPYCLEGLVALYALTREDGYLQLARRVADHAPLELRPKTHSHSFLLVCHGLADLFDVTQDDRHLKTLEHLWEIIQREHQYISGGIPEYFPDEGGDEGCSGLDWLQVNLHLWRATGKGRYLDCAERILFNHIPFGQAPNGDFVGQRDLTGRVGQLWDYCCTHLGAVTYVSALENIFNTAVDPHLGNLLYINFYIPSEAQVHFSDGTQARVTQQGSYTRDGRVRLTMHTESPAHFEMRFRLPGYWRDSLVANKTALRSAPQGVSVEQSTEHLILRAPKGGWRNGDEIQLDFAPTLRAERRADAAKQAALWYGPLLLIAAPDGAHPNEISRARITDANQDIGTLQYGRSFRGTPLRLGDREYKNGFGAHANSRIRVEMGILFQCLRADLGLDAGSVTEGAHGSVVFVVKPMEGFRGSQKERFRSDVLRAGDPPRSIEIEMVGMPWVTLEALDGGDGIAGDQADWAGVRLVTYDGTELILSDLVREFADVHYVPLPLPEAGLDRPESVIRRLPEARNEFGIAFALAGSEASIIPLAAFNPVSNGFSVWFPITGT